MGIIFGQGIIDGMGSEARSEGSSDMLEWAINGMAW